MIEKRQRPTLQMMVLPALFICHIALVISCSEAQEHTAPAVYPQDSASVMVSHGINMQISDSGVIKYSVVAEQWDVNTVRQPSRWEFTKGIYFEQFDEQFHVQANIQADSAWYYDQQRLWHLRGRVSIHNNNGLVYTSEELYWDGLKHEFYSTVFSRVVTPERTMEGTYFRSDEQMNHYLITNSRGSFVAADIEGTDDTSSGDSSATGDRPDDMPPRDAPTRQR